MTACLQSNSTPLFVHHQTPTHYFLQPPTGSREAKLMKVLREPRDWLQISDDAGDSTAAGR